MYSHIQRLRAIEAYERNGFNWRATVRELGYGSRGSLRNWHAMFLKNNRELPDTSGRGRWSLEERRLAVDHFLEHGRCLARTCRALGYPNAALLARWVDELAPGARAEKPPRREFGAAERADAVVRLLLREETSQAIADDVGVSKNTLYAWKDSLLGKEVPDVMERERWEPGATIEQIRELERRKRELEEEIRRLALRRDVMEGTVELLGKDRSADPRTLTNREKALLVESLRPAHKLGELLEAVGLAKSSYRYQLGLIGKPDKYADLRIRICEIFRESRARYGYRRIHAVLKGERVRVSEKVVRKVMAEEGLCACRPKRRKYSSYRGEISDAPENLVKRDFHADRPNAIWLTDISEFSIPAGKAYLSPMIDCFDGAVVARAMSTSPNAELVNTMLDSAAATLREGDRPIEHNDRGCHYRWPGWIERCERYGITRSMSKKGCSPDNAAMEGFFGRLKVEFFYERDWEGWTIEQFMEALDEYIDWYNEKRIKVSLGGMSPMQYRRALGLAA